jgi:hypothetical protein
MFTTVLNFACVDQEVVVERRCFCLVLFFDYLVKCACEHLSLHTYRNKSF